MIVGACRDPNDIKRPVTSVAWHPEGPDRMVVSHCIVNFQQHTPDISLDCYVYRTGSLVNTCVRRNTIEQSK